MRAGRYRVLAIDLDPQASLSALHGFQPEFDLLDGGTLYDAIRYEDPLSLRDIIRPTYFTNLSIVPGNLELMEFEHETPRALAARAATCSSPGFRMPSPRSKPITILW